LFYPATKEKILNLLEFMIKNQWNNELEPNQELFKIKSSWEKCFQMIKVLYKET
jgi:hypothetical protein